ncbi:MAG: antibiotic biosynthesis monooxygenase [Solirubrobacteraceae bacterium]
MSDPVTFVNVIDVDPSKHQELIDLLAEGTEKVMSKRPGFISVTLLASLDRTRVINVARWASADDVKATQADPDAAEYAKRTAAIARPGPGLYAVVGEFAA